MRVAAVQMRSGLSRENNLADAVELITRAAHDGARLIVTPEMTTVLDKDRARLVRSLSEGEPDEESTFAALSADTGATIVIGSAATLIPGEERIANRSMVFAQGKRAAFYDKVHLFDVDLPTGESWRESKVYRPGGEGVIVETGGAKVGLSICYDLRFPHFYRKLAAAGADILTVPAAFTVPTGQAHWEILLRARAIETGSFVIAAAQGGEHEDGRKTYGRSMIVSPWGEVLDRLPHDEPGVAAADIDLAAVGDTRTRIPSLALETEPQIRIYRA
ncbi:MAG: carbon-nitrogen hydrolase family protein [Parvularcula sp.]|jgi:predicted amidohydrolase|nr:carbon-nitrogen hydrolase family protein [Parvularcula sp.]